MLRFKRFRSRILCLFLGLFGLVQVATFYAVETANLRNAHQQIGEALETGARVFNRLLENRTGHLADNVRLLATDYAFKKIVATRDRASLLSALDSYRQRGQADAIMIVSMEGELLADTLHPQTTNPAAELAPVIRLAENTESGESAALAFIDRQAYQWVVTPLLAPNPVAWIVTGFVIDDRLAGEFKALTQADVSLLTRAADQSWSQLASTLPGGLQAALPGALSGANWQPDKSFALVLGLDAEYVALITPLGHGTPAVFAVLQQPIEEKLRPFHRLNEALLALGLTGLLFAVTGSVWIAHSVTRPVSALAEGVRRIERGEYGYVITLPYRDEVGQLAGAFNHMSQGLAERDRMRDLLGKVVSPAIAQELLARDIQLGGEEIEATILFSDIRGFTTLSESVSPKVLLDLLNIYLTAMSAVVEKHGGVVDKYVGDAVMALFGAPLPDAGHADRALLAALDMVSASERLNRDFQAQGLPPLNIGIGVNSGRMVAGNMGSRDRLNYTVIGDPVNLAARLESLTKEKAYGTKIIVGEATLGKARGAYRTRALGQVVVKGKTQAVGIFALTGEA
ncbi:adenylate/guanylate cyclase domain-containing protein [Methylomagnum sp.]